MVQHLFDGPQRTFVMAYIGMALGLSTGCQEPRFFGCVRFTAR